MCEDNKKRKELERIEHIQDSIRNTPEYIDSVKRERERSWRLGLQGDSITLSNTLVITRGVEFYHYFVKCYNISEYQNNDTLFYLFTKNKDEYKVMTEEEAITLGLKLCYKCEEIDDIINQYENNELINKDDIDKYVKEQELY